MALVDKLIFAGVAFMPLLIGLGLIYEGYRQRRMAETMADVEPTPIVELTSGDEPVEVTGEAHPVGEDTLATEFHDRDAVRVTRTVSEFSADTGATGSQAGWGSKYSTHDEVEWVIDDGTGEIAVDVPPKGNVSLGTTSFAAEEGETPPAEVQAWLDTLDDVESALSESRRYLESSIEVGEEVYVFGEARERDDAPTDLVLTAEAVPDRFNLTDISEDHVAGERKSGGFVLYLVGGLIFTLIGAGFEAVIWLS